MHTFLRSRREEQAACFACRKGANLGIVLTKVRMVMPELDSAF